MHIKQVIIEGFKSYREQVATENFSPKLNCVVGANGSGKSNFFQAIRYVLSDLFQNLGNDGRQALLHEGAGHQVLSAFVEIVFDNSDNRIPVDKEEVRLRRTIGLKKDEYFLDKRITKTEVMNLLESAGFSRSNPYYVVQQGKIASLTMMKDSERLELLKEIGGTRVYEEKRRESLKIMQETDNKRKQIIQIVQYLDERLKELDQEKDELRKYQQLDKHRKSLEYAIYDKELIDVQKKLSEVEEARTKVSETSTRMYNNVVGARNESEDLDKTFKDRTKELETLTTEKEMVITKRIEAIENHTKLVLDVQDLEEKFSQSIRAKEEATKQLEALEKEIKDTMEELDKIRPSYDEKVVQEKEIAQGLMELENQLKMLHQKQGRVTQFSNKADRDKWLQKEIDDLEKFFSLNLTLDQKLVGEIDKLKNELNKCDLYIENHIDVIVDLQSLVVRLHKGFKDCETQRDRLMDERKSLWVEENELSQEINKLETDVGKAKDWLDFVTPGDVRRGLKFINGIVKDQKITGVFGSIIDLLECDHRFYTAVQTTAGYSLFHVVVDNDETCTPIIRQLSQAGGGRVTFMPLNRMEPLNITYPDSADVLPLVNKLKFSPQFAPAFKQVFARTVVCRDIDVATRVARTHSGLVCITLEGDEVSEEGGMTGGFYENRWSTLKFVSTIREGKKSIVEKEHELEKIRTTLQKKDQDITKEVSELAKIDAKATHERSELIQHEQDIANAEKHKKSILKALQNKEKSREDIKTHLNQIPADIATKRAEMGTEIIDQLTAEEKDLLSRLNPEITQCKERLFACRKGRIETETRKAELEDNLTTNLRRRKHELEAIISSTDTDTSRAEIELKKLQLDGADSLVREAVEQLQRLSDAIDKLTEQIKSMEDKKNELKALEDSYGRTLEDEANELEQLLSKRNTLAAKVEYYSKKIRDLGPLSSDSFDMNRLRNVKECHKMLHDCNEQMQLLSHVNKKALEQYVSFTEQREELQKRQEELNSGDEKIKELIQGLDQRKDESIERTFKGVARHFREVFSELVQGGHGHLVMMKKKDVDGDDDCDEDVADEAGVEGMAEKYIGVKVKVSFTGQGETQSMKQLSGGQKTVVALAFIFAIQRCDPAPFYLFDEIDAALDPQYRTAVANMIRRVADSANTQFISTTFRPELVKVADKIYGVTHNNRVSHVNVVSKEDALDFIEHDQS